MTPRPLPGTCSVVCVLVMLMVCALSALLQDPVWVLIKSNWGRCVCEPLNRSEGRIGGYAHTPTHP